MIGVFFALFDFFAQKLAAGNRIHALDALGDIAIGNAFHFQLMQMAEIGDLLEGEGRVFHQPDGGGLGHEGRV